MDQAAIDTQADLIFAYLKAIYDVAGYAEPLMWLIKTQLPKADILDASRVNTIMGTVITCLGYQMWITSRLMFQSALVLIIFDHYKELHYKDVTEMASKYPQFTCLSVDEQKQLLSFRNLLVVAVKIFNPHENATDVLTLVGSTCGHTSSWYTCPKKRLHRELIFLLETGIEVRYTPTNSNDTSVRAAKPYIPTKKLTSMRETGSNYSATTNKRRTEPSSSPLHAPTKRSCVEPVYITDEPSATQFGAGAVEGAYDIVQLHCAYSSSNNSSEGNDNDADCDTDEGDDRGEEEEEDEASLQSVSESEDEEEKEGEKEEVNATTFVNGSGLSDSTITSKQPNSVPSCVSTRSDAERPNNAKSSAFDCVISSRKKPLRKSLGSAGSVGAHTATQNTIHHNNVRIAADNVLRTASFSPGSMHAVLNAHLGGYYTVPHAAPTYNMPSMHMCSNVNPALYTTQPGGGLSAPYSSQYAPLPSGSDHHPLSLTVSMASLSAPTSSSYSSPLPVSYATTHLHPQSCALYPVTAMPRTVPIVSRAVVNDSGVQHQDVCASPGEMS